MTRLFRNIRIAGFVSIAAFSAVVLGISAYLATKLLPNIRHDFTIFALVPPSWTILMCIVLLLVSTPRVEVTATFMTGVLWLIMGAWLADDLGSRTCTSLAGQTTQLQDGTISSEQYCDMQKVQEAFAWLLFILMLLWFFIVITLAHRSVAMGREYIWSENTNFLPWFGQVPSWPGLEEGQWPAQFRPFYGYPGFSQMPTVQSQPMYVQSQPGFVGSQPGYVQTHPSYVSHAPTGVPMSAY